MQARTTSAHLVEAYLLLEQPRQRLSHWTQSLAALDDDHAPPLAGISAYYDPETDQALLGLRYDELALGPAKLAYVVDVALLAEIGMIQPHALSEGDRKRFVGERLARCTLEVSDKRTVLGAFTELVRRIRELKQQHHQSGPKVLAAVVKGKPPPKAARGLPSGDPTALQVKPKGTRDDLVKQNLQARGTRDAMTPDRDTDPYRPTNPAVLPQGIIYARYLRSGRWVPIRIGALSLKGAALMSGALPRVHDHVDLAFAYGDHRALVRGPVSKVSTVEETAQSGAATFSVEFELDDAARRALTSLLTAARAAQVTIKPPPPRSTRRYPVEWPVCLNTIRGVVRADALDISYGGMFVRPAHPLAADSALSFSIVLDDGGSPISGRAKVVRHVTETDAHVCGLVPGVGLHITDMSDVDLGRWMTFLARIEKRAEKRVLIGATPGRLVELQTALAAIGYAVSGGTDPGALVQLAGAERPVDAVLLDGDWLAPGTSTSWIESLFSARKVPCVTLHGEPRRGRLAIDKLLSIS
jgi:hypothetical protein